MSVLIIETNEYKNFLPISRTKFLWDITTGIFTPYQRFEKQFHDVKVYSQRLENEPYSLLKNEIGNKLYNPENNINTIINSQFIPFENLSPQINRIGITKDGKFVYIRLENIKKDLIDMICNNEISNLLSKYQEKEVEGIYINNFLDIIKYNSKIIEYETYLIKSDSNFISPNNNIYIDKTAKIMQFVSMQPENGSIIIDKGAIIKPFSYIEGPSYIGKGSIIENSKIKSGTTIKEYCKINGEISESIFESYSIKDGLGFIGNSYIGNCVYIGNQTSICNFKNNLENINLKLGNEIIEANLEKFGAIIGDYSTLGMGLIIKEGSIISEFSSLFLSDNPVYSNCKPFSWGMNSKYKIDKLIDFVKKRMKIHNIQLSSEKEKFIIYLYKNEN